MKEATRPSSRDALRSEVAALRAELAELRTQLATEVRTQRLVVVGPDGFERITAGTTSGNGTVQVNSKREVWVALVADDDDGASAEVYLSGGRNGVGHFGVDEMYFGTGDVEYVASFGIDPTGGDERFHGVSIDCAGLHFGG